MFRFSKQYLKTTFFRPLSHFSLKNAVCEGAAVLVIGSTVTGTTVGSPPPLLYNCGVQFDNAGAAWYKFTGIGNPVTASMCNATTFDTKLSVFTGPCSNLMCVGGADDTPGCGRTSEMTFDTKFNESYYLLVHGFGTQRGTFSLTLSSLTSDFPGHNGAPPKPKDPLLVGAPQKETLVLNSTCETAFPLVPTATGTTVGGSTMGEPSIHYECGSNVSHSSGARWFKFPGSGYPVRASTCNAANFDTRIEVLSGNCR